MREAVFGTSPFFPGSTERLPWIHAMREMSSPVIIRLLASTISLVRVELSAPFPVVTGSVVGTPRTSTGKSSLIILALSSLWIVSAARVALSFCVRFSSMSLMSPLGRVLAATAPGIAFRIWSTISLLVTSLFLSSESLAGRMVRRVDSEGSDGYWGGRFGVEDENAAISAHERRLLGVAPWACWVSMIRSSFRWMSFRS